MLPIHPKSIDGYNLFHEGILALSDVELNGIPINVEHCEKQYALLDKKIKRTKRLLEKRKEVKYWKKKYRERFNLDSKDQLSDILFNYLKFEPKVFTAKGKPSTAQQALEQIDAPIVEDLTLLGRLQKARNNYIKNYLLEQVNGFLYPFFNLHTVRSLRSSSSAINFQNQPTRIPWVKKLVRPAVIPLPGYMIAEMDFSGIEVAIGACYHKDPNLIADIVDPSKDMHRDMAKECYLLDDDEWTKETRYNGKNKFVFPQFYGDYYVTCAQSLWDAIHIQDLKTRQGKPLKKHLRSKGITSYAKFENHIKAIEDYFWNERYPIYNQWKEDHWKKYQNNGFVDLKTGFRCSGYMKKNECINYPVQGSAFHCLLWCLIQLNKWLKEKNKLSKIIGQIHDSIVMIIHPSELNTVLRRAYKIMEHELISHWPWIIVPMKVETEASPVDGSWLLKKEVHKHKCKCGSHWMYKDKTETTTIWECPICRSKEKI